MNRVLISSHIAAAGDMLEECYMRVHGIMQHWQSSPHQQGSFTGGFMTGAFAVDAADALEVADAVEGGIVWS